MRGAETIETRSLALHAAVVRRLVAAPVEQIAAAIVDPGERGQRLRRSIGELSAFHETFGYYRPPRASVRL